LAAVNNVTAGDNGHEQAGEPINQKGIGQPGSYAKKAKDMPVVCWL